MGRPKKYFTESEKKAAHRAQQTEWKKNNPEYMSEYRSTPYGRAKCLLNGYRKADKKRNRECTLTEDWIIQNIFSGQVCAHCGESDWRKLGVNRLDNSKPHTPDNVEPCCWECNNRLGNEDSKKPVYQYNLDGLLVAIWPSTKECGKNGYHQGNVAACCRGERNAHKGYRWSYEPL